MRLFVAIELSDPIRATLSNQIQYLRNTLGDEGVKWVKPSAIHLTLKFLGETPEHKLDRIKGTLREISPRFPPFSFELGTFGCFPNLKRPRVLWIGIQETTGILKDIHKELEMGFQQLGFKSENRPFKAHLTLGRIRKNLNSSQLKVLTRNIGDITIGRLGTEIVREICLIRSILRPTGAEYTTLGTYLFTEKEHE
jgi:2'-5' RNA ligase